MQDLVIINKDVAITSSLQVAEIFNKQHRDVLRKIDKIISENHSAQNCAQCYQSSTYRDSTGKSNPMYFMNRDGFVFLAMGFTGAKANEWKWKYIEAFNKMEEYIKTSLISKVNQKDAMKILHDNNALQVDYIKANGITNKAVSNKYGYPKMIKKADMDAEQLSYRDEVLNETVKLMAMKKQYNLDFSIKEKIYERFS